MTYVYDYSDRTDYVIPNVARYGTKTSYKYTVTADTLVTLLLLTFLYTQFLYKYLFMHIRICYAVTLLH